MINPHRGWTPVSHGLLLMPPALPGRNDGCPCGSGRKYKKCCIGNPDMKHQVAPNPAFRKAFEGLAEAATHAGLTARKLTNLLTEHLTTNG